MGGTPTQVDAWPGAVQLEDSSGWGICGGTLVADRWVLTAGHCFFEPEHPTKGIAAVVVGRTVVASDAGERIAVDQAIRHEDFDAETIDNDVALLHLAEPSSAPKARLATSEQWRSFEREGAVVTVVGWGRTKSGGQPSTAIREVSVPLVAQSDCVHDYELVSASVTANMFCAGLAAGGKDSCQGDSGGPLFAAIGGVPTQVGIVSWGVGCGSPLFPGVYTRLANYLDWVTTTTGGEVLLGVPEPAPGDDEASPSKPSSTSAKDPTDTVVDHDVGAEEDDTERGDEDDGAVTPSEPSRARGTTGTAGCQAAVSTGSHGGPAILGAVVVVALGRRRRRRARALPPRPEEPCRSPAHDH